MVKGNLPSQQEMVAKKTAKKQGRKGARKGKSATAKTKKASSTKRSSSARPPVIEVQKKEDVAKLINLIKKSTVVVVAITAPWCPHCKTFKEDIWNKLKTLPQRQLPMAEVNGDILAETPLSSAKIDGYPSVVTVGSDMEMATLRDENGELTNSLPNTRDMRTMETLVSSDPGLVSAEPASAEPASEEVEESLRESANRLIRSIKNNSASTNASAGVLPPPSPEDDLIMSQSMPAQAPRQTGANMEGGAAAMHRRRSRRGPGPGARPGSGAGSRRAASIGSLFSFLKMNTRRK